MRRVPWNEWVWAGAWAVVVVGLALLPFVGAALWAPSGSSFSGLLVNPQDGNSYLAKMRQGAQGAWLFHLPYSTEEHRGALLFPLYLLLGKGGAALHLPMVVAFHLARALAGLFLLLMVYLFIASLLDAVPVRRLAYLFVALGSGLSWLTSLWGYLASDLLIPESNTFHTIFANPHFPLATGLLLAVFLAARRAVERERWGLSLVAGGLSLLLTVAQPFLYLSSVGVLLLWMVLRGWASRSFPLLQFQWLLPAFLLPFPYLGLAAWALYRDPILRLWTEQNVTASPSLLAYALGFGVVALGALLGLAALRRRTFPYGITVDSRLFLLAWALAGAVLAYLPFAFQRRLSEGWHVPLSILAAVGFSLFLLDRVGSPQARRALTVGLLAAAMPTTLFLPTTAVLGAHQMGEPFFIPQEEMQALVWLKQETSPAEAVLASPWRGNQIPAWAGNRVFWGHPFETVHSQAKLQLLDRFFSGEMMSTESEKLLQDAGIVLLYYGGLERRMGAFDPSQEPYLEPVYTNPQVTIYRVMR